MKGGKGKTMSILIKGMEMPKNCIDCPCYYPEYYECNIVHNCNPISHNDPIPQYCPLIEVPKHGRLIDADDIESITVKFEKIPLNNDWVLSSIDAPTIIESEGEK